MSAWRNLASVAFAHSVFSVEDLQRAAEALGTRHVELSADGQLIVSPASDEHEFAVGRRPNCCGR